MQKPGQVPSAPPQVEEPPFTKYLATVRTQITSAKELHDILTDFAKNLSQAPAPGTVVMQPPS